MIEVNVHSRDGWTRWLDATAVMILTPEMAKRLAYKRGPLSMLPGPVSISLNGTDWTEIHGNIEFGMPHMSPFEKFFHDFIAEIDRAMLEDGRERDINEEWDW